MSLRKLFFRQSVLNYSACIYIHMYTHAMLLDMMECSREESLIHLVTYFLQYT